LLEGLEIALAESCSYSSESYGQRRIIGLDIFEDFNARPLAEIELLEFWNEQLCGYLIDADRADALIATAEERYRVRLGCQLPVLCEPSCNSGKVDAE
jgi:hypothetical protein